ncbi:MAG: helix-turn-helix domain-containing protein [Deltaproteobacteria bacterium]|jgi:DNA-binding transcriptional regulator YiaG|nr:helix-turn-helix domain-containing protein [Deltaproteobacteria bacterium]
MNKTTELLRQMLDDPSGAMLRPVRKTELLPQADGSLVRRITDKAGNVTEDTISVEQRLSLDARMQLEMSQQQFAAMLGISVRTLHDWEQGRREPSGAARTLLKIAARHPDVVREVMQPA